MITCTPSLRSSSFDGLFFSQNIGDLVAVILRVLTKYTPILVLRNHSGIISFDQNTFPLATLTNATEWYSNYVIILSALVFSFDRAVMAVSIKSYSWFCNSMFKVCLIIMTWLLPIAWVLPMLDPCCKSQYYGGRMELVEMQKHEADVTYDSIDMIFETIFYVPVLCFMNGFSLILLYYQWLKLVRKKKAGNKSNSTGPLPNISVVSSLCVDREMSIYLPHLEGFESDERQERLIERLDLELSFCMISIIDQQIDFCAVLFYSLYWASYSGYVGVGATLFFEVYNYFFEIGTILSPYVLLAFCANLRKEFKEKIKCYP